MDAHDANALRLLTDSLRNLAAEPVAQLAALSMWGPEALAEDHHAPAFNAGWMYDEGLISPRMREFVERIDATFRVMSGRDNTHRWSDDALTDDPGWIEIRAMAREALGLLD
jgi:hypothetical protein